MEAVRLGLSDVRVSRVVFGAMAMGGAARDAERRMAVMRAAIDAGCTSIDTAPLYERGRSEELVGKVIAGMRDRVQVLTKVGLRWDDPREHGAVLFPFVDEHGVQRCVRRNSRPESVRLEVERSLKWLGVEVLDVVQVHHVDLDTPIADTMGALAELRKEGKLLAIGVSNYDPAQMRQARAALGDVPLASNQLEYSLIERDIERGLLSDAAAVGVGVLAYSPLAQGLLSEAFDRSRLVTDDWRLQQARMQPKNVARIRAVVDAALRPVALRLDTAVSEVALAWLLAQPGLSAVIVGASSPEQARSNALAARLVLGAEDVRSIRGAFEALQLDARAGQGPFARAKGRVERLVRLVHKPRAVRRRLPL